MRLPTLQAMIQKHCLTLTRFRQLAWQGFYLRILNPPYMPLVIEAIGTGPRDLPLISVAHYFEQHGDLCADPDVTFEVSDRDANAWEWLPVTFQQALPPMYHEAVFRDGGKVLIRPTVLRSLCTFARHWDTNVREQGFLNQPNIIAIPTRGDDSGTTPSAESPTQSPAGSDPQHR